MRGFQKGITLGGRTSGSALKVIWWGGGGGGGGGGPLDFSVTQVKSLDFTLSLDLTRA